jgi:hypothetical protein
VTPERRYPGSGCLISILLSVAVLGIAGLVAVEMVRAGWL